MRLVEPKLGELLARIVKQCLREGHAVELDGLGTFTQDQREGLQFIADCAPHVFIAYASENTEQALRLANDLAAAGLKPWIDRRKLLPGQNWRRAIQRAIERSDFFIACFSGVAVRKRGQFPNEVRLAMRWADRMPLDDSFVVPVRLEDCDVPHEIQSHIQYVDLYPDWEKGVEKLTASIWDEFGARLERTGG
jgi:hypothetical protein